MSKTNLLGKQQAFTLVELLAVMVIMGILAGSVMFSLKTPYQSAKMENALERIMFMDRQLRDHARRFNRPAEMQINFTNGVVTGAEPKKRETVIPSFSLGAGVQIDQVAFGRHRIDSGVVSIDFSAHGCTPTYAMRFSNGSNIKHWLVFLGITGQIVQIDNEKEIDELLHMVQSQRTDAG
jgi:prepilin-type N-terminal cleavage/methylation domain-containing protein